MQTYVVLIRGINVGGKSKVPMAELRACLTDDCGCADVETYINSGNAVVRSKLSAAQLATAVETALPKRCTIDSERLRVHVLPEKTFRAVIADKPKGFGDSPDEYHSDAIFLIEGTAKQALEVFDPREGVDQVWPGTGVIYHQRLSALRTKSRMSKIVGTKPYQSMTIRNWRTTMKLLAMLDARTD